MFEMSLENVYADRITHYINGYCIDNEMLYHKTIDKISN